MQSETNNLADHQPVKMINLKTATDSEIEEVLDYIHELEFRCTALNAICESYESGCKQDSEFIQLIDEQKSKIEKRQKGLDRKMLEVVGAKSISPKAAAMRQSFAAMPTDILIDTAKILNEEIISRNRQMSIRP